MAWVARDEDYALYLYEGKPIKGADAWVVNPTTGGFSAIDAKFFPEITWEDDESREIVLK